MSIATLLVACNMIAADVVSNRSPKGGNVVMTIISTIMDCGAGFLSRIPDELELAHR